MPDFAALAQVQDKVAAFQTLARLGLPQPRATVVTSADALDGIDELPAFVKTPVGTASAGVRRVSTRAELRQHAAQSDLHAGVLIQQTASGPLAMVQSVFANGELVAFHACERAREGASGGASHKRGISLPGVRTHIDVLGKALNWHGALSADVILIAEGPAFIDINPRLVEPVNAAASGVDLVGTLVEVASSGTGTRQLARTLGVRTHQALLALPVAAAALATLIHPAAWRHFAAGATSAYSLTPAAWRRLLDTATAGHLNAADDGNEDQTGEACGRSEGK